MEVAAEKSLGGEKMFFLDAEKAGKLLSRLPEGQRAAAEHMFGTPPETRVENIRELMRACACDAIPLLAEKLHDDSEDVKEAAIDALAKMDFQKAESWLNRFVHYAAPADSEAMIRARSAADDIRKIRGRIEILLAERLLIDKDMQLGALGGLMNAKSKQSTPLIEELLDDEEPEVRKGAIAALAYIWGRECPSIPLIERRLEDPDPRVRGAAVSWLGFIFSRRSAPLIRKLVNDPNEEVRTRTLQAMGMLDEEGSRALFEQHLSDRNPEIRATSLAYACDKTEKTLPLVKEKLNDESREVRIMAVGLLDNYPPENGLSLLENAAMNDTDETVRRHAIVSIAIVARKHKEYLSRCATFLEARLDDKSAKVRAGIIEDLAWMGASKSVPAIQKMLDDDQPKVRINAIRALLKLMGKDCLNAIEKMANDSDKEVSAVAYGILHDIAPERFPLKGEGWGEICDVVYDEWEL